MKRGLGIGLALIMLIACIGAVASFEDSTEIEASVEPPALPSVRYAKLTTGTNKGYIRTTGRIESRWKVELTARVSGRVMNVFSDALVGETVIVGTPLVQIEKDRYFANLQNAKHTLKQSLSNLANAERKTSLAKAEWSRNKPNFTPNELALHIPELRTAKAGVEAAKAQVKVAENDFDATEVVAPLSGYITKRLVNIGQTVNAGDVLLTILDNQTLDISVSLSRDEWSLLSTDLQKQSIPIYSNGEKVALAKVRAKSEYLDVQTGLHKIHLVVVNEDNELNLFAGENVTVELPSRWIEKTIAIPDSAMTRDGYFWHIDAEDRLQRLRPDIAYHEGETVVIHVKSRADWRVVLTPLVSFSPGMLVDPVGQGNVSS